MYRTCVPWQPLPLAPVKHLLLIIALLTCALSEGCCLWRQQNPVSDSVVASRQFAQQGLNALERSNLSEAEKYCSQAVRACPSDPNARRSYADVLWAQGRTQEALEQIDAALASGVGGDVETRLRAAEMRLQAGNLDAALVDVEQVIDADPKSAEAWALRGRVMLVKGNAKQSLADMQRSLIYAPRRRDVLRQTAELYQRLGEPHKALAALQELGDTYGPGEEPQDIYIAQGNVYAALARPAEAAEQFRTALARGTANADLLVLLSEAEAAAGNSTAAYQAAQQALAIAPDNPRHQELIQRTAAAMPLPSSAMRR